MRKILYDKNLLNIIGIYSAEDIIESDCVIETEIEGQVHLEKIDGKIVVIEDILTVEEQKQDIQRQLDDLDKKSIRDAEDLYNKLIAKGIIVESDVPFIAQRVEQKNQLRQQLQVLG